MKSPLTKLTGLVTLALAATFSLPTSPAAAASSGGVNDASCRPSSAHPNPVVFLHGLGATHYEDLNFLQADVASRGYCTFSETYAAYPGFPLVGGLRPIADSATEIKAFVLQVLATTGAKQVDLVGHSEGGFQSLYVTKTQGIADRIGKVIAIAPPTHGTTFAGTYNLAYLLGQPSRDLVSLILHTVGCAACDDVGIGGSAVATLNKGPITQPGVDYTIITSRSDELVTPTETSFVREQGVTNTYVQDACPSSRVGHVGEAYDRGVWDLVENALDPTHAVAITCSVGIPL